jgi:hypothetical protein
LFLSSWFFKSFFWKSFFDLEGEVLILFWLHGDFWMLITHTHICTFSKVRTGFLSSFQRYFSLEVVADVHDFCADPICRSKEKDLLVVGPGVLGSLIATIWLQVCCIISFQLSFAFCILNCGRKKGSIQRQTEFSLLLQQ